LNNSGKSLPRFKFGSYVKSIFLVALSLTL
jgi:hypothetical protein